MIDDTHYLPSARLLRPALEQQSKAVAGSGVLLRLINTASEPLAILNPQRQIVFCNEACWRLGGLASMDEALGMRPGELLQCVNVTRDNASCGTTENCRFCGLAHALVQGQSGLFARGRCLIESSAPERPATLEYRVQVTPLPELGTGWECYALTDISQESRRRALERAFFHDIMNRAFAVEGVANTLAEPGLSEAEREDFTTMLGVAVRGLVEEVKSQRVLLAAESGELAVNSVPVNSLDVLRGAIQTCAAFWLDEDVRLEIGLGSDSVDFESDPALVGRILVNLIKNAIESSAAGDIVTARCRRDGEEVHFSVQNGSVMEPAVAARVFQRSFSTKGRGRGQGTHSVRLLTEQYLGGAVRFESAPGLGTIFHVRLPLQARPAATQPLSA